MNLEVIEKYKLYLQYQSMSIHTRRNYLQRVKGFLQWIDGSPEGATALMDPLALNLQIRDYKAYLLARGASASTINSVLSAIDNLSISLGMELGKVKRLELSRQYFPFTIMSTALSILYSPAQPTRCRNAPTP